MDGPQSHRDTEFADLNRVTARIIGCAIEVHKVLGPGACWNRYTSRQCASSSMTSRSSTRVKLRFRRTTRGICPVSTESILLFRISFSSRSRALSVPLPSSRLSRRFSGCRFVFLPSGCCGFDTFEHTSRLRLQPFPRPPLRSFVISVRRPGVVETILPVERNVRLRIFEILPGQ